MPGSEADESHGGPSGHAEPAVGLDGTKAPLPYVRGRNALKIIMDLDQNWGLVKMPQGQKLPTGLFGKSS